MLIQLEYQPKDGDISRQELGTFTPDQVIAAVAVVKAYPFQDDDGSWWTAGMAYFDTGTDPVSLNIVLKETEDPE